MSNRLQALYEEMILDHNRNPRNCKEIHNPTHVSHGMNPLCGDDYRLYLRLLDGKIEEAGFEGSGCAISKSSASMMTVMIKGKSKEEVLELKEAFVALVTQEGSEVSLKEKIGKLAVFVGVRQFPVRVKCATLIWRALEDALQNTEIRAPHTVSTE